MILADLCVRRPVFATMFVGVLVVLGWFSYMRLGVDLFPKVDVPTVMVTTFLPGAAPEETEARVTKPIEEAVNTVSGIDEMRSSTLEGVSRVTIQFKLERDLDAAVQDVRDKISTVLDQLPDGTKPPLVQKFDLDAVPVVTITVTGYQSLKELTELARRRLKEPLESVDGVGSIDIVGGREREVHVDVDADKLHATGVTIQQVGAALSRQNVEYPGGRMKQGMSEEMLRTLGRITEVPDFAKVIVSEAEGRPVTVGDVASVEDSVKEPRSLSRWDNKNAVSLIVRKQSGENTIEVVDRVKERYETIKGTLPARRRRDLHARRVHLHPRRGRHRAGASLARRPMRRDRGVLFSRLDHLDADRRGRDSRFDHRDLLVDPVDGLHAQPHDLARTDARGRNRDRRRHRRARKYFPLHRRKEHGPDGRGESGHRRGRARRQRDHALARRHLRARSRSSTA